MPSAPVTTEFVERARSRPQRPDRTRLEAAVNTWIDSRAWHRLLRLRTQWEGDCFAGVPPERLAEFPPEWVERARGGAFLMEGARA